jgi:hypothetical protein
MAQKNEWLDTTRQKLHDAWVKKTGHRKGASNNTWACEIARGCRQCNEHLSLPCTLLQEANEIASFLSSGCFTDQPASFVRFYLMLLFEFTSQLSDVAELLDLQVGKTPRSLSIWANRWAKHRLHILVQHHPTMIYADQHPNWGEIKPLLPRATVEDKCGNKRPAMIIDEQWLANARGPQPNLSLANGEARAAVVIPPLMSFLEETMEYFREFIDAALAVPNKVREFQSGHYTVRC